jgi:hypothetical protein
MKRQKDLELESMNPSDAAWANLLSSAADLREVDENASAKVLNALNLERTQNLEGCDETWAKYLSSAAVLRPVDYGSVQPALIALRLERARVQKVWRLNIMKFVTASAAIAAVVIGVIVFRPISTEADPNEAFAAYQEANQGW